MTRTKRSLVVYGASGAGRRVVDIALDMLDAAPDVPFDAVEVIDDSPTPVNLERLRRTGVRYLGTSESWLRGAPHAYFSIGVGDTTLRRELAGRLSAAGHTPATLVAPSAHLSRSAVLGPGCVISPGVDLSADVELGAFVHVMANASVSHDVAVSDFVNVNPGAVIAGSCQVGAGATIGAGAVVLQGLRVGHHSTVGAGACVVRDVPPDSVVKGSAGALTPTTDEARTGVPGRRPPAVTVSRSRTVPAHRAGTGEPHSMTDVAERPRTVPRWDPDAQEGPLP